MTETQRDAPVDIGIFIPVKNGMQWLPRVIDSLRNQQTTLTYSILIVDSGSTDGSPAYLQEQEIQCHRISPDSFSHSKTRNLALTLHGPTRYLLFMSQDAIPLGATWLDELHGTLAAHASLKAVCATEMQNPDDPFSIRGGASFVFRHTLHPATYVIPAKATTLHKDLPPSCLRRLFCFSNVCCLYERDYLAQYPFDESFSFGEDIAWAVATSDRGDHCGCTNRAQVLHQGSYSLLERIQKRRLTEQVLTRLFDYRPPGIPRRAYWGIKRFFETLIPE